MTAYPMLKIAQMAMGLALVCAALQIKAQPVAITLPADTSTLRESTLPGYTIAQQKCGICHSADYINFQPPGMSLVQWTAEMSKMQHTYGAPLTGDEIEQVGAYLAVTYGSAQATDAEVEALTAAANASRQTELNAGAGQAVDVPALLTANACLGCHALDHKVLGPGFNEVAAKYKGNPDAASIVATSIRQGGVEKWGDVAMPPMSNLNDAQLHALVEFVLDQ